MKNKSQVNGASLVCEVLRHADVRIIRISGPSGCGLTSILHDIRHMPEIFEHAVIIEDIFFASGTGFLGWLSNALGLYEGSCSLPGVMPEHLLEIIRLRKIRYLIMDDFHEAFRESGVTAPRIARDINILLKTVPNLQMIISLCTEVETPEYSNLLEWKIRDVILDAYIKLGCDLC